MRTSDADSFPEQTRSCDFGWLWGAQSISLFGSSMTLLALPLLAVVELDASALQMGYLGAAGMLPFLLVSLPAGIWVDRRTRRPLLVVADVVRGGLLIAIPVLAWFGLLRMPQLYATAFIIGALSVVFEIAHYAYVPDLVGRDQVVRANSRLQVSYSVADSAGPAAAALVVQALSIPIALALDALSYLMSAAMLCRIRRPEHPARTSAPSSLWAELGAGLQFIASHPLLRVIVRSAIIDSFCIGGVVALFVLYANRSLGLGAIALGAVFAARGIGAIPGAMLSDRVARAVGVGPTIVLGWSVATLAWLLVPVVFGPSAVVVLLVAAFVGGLAGTIFNIQQWSLRQIVTPDRLQGRVTAAHRFLVYGAEPLGALAAGLCATSLGLRPTLALFSAVALLAPAIVACSDVRKLVSQPRAAQDETVAIDESTRLA